MALPLPPGRTRAGGSAASAPGRGGAAGAAGAQGAAAKPQGSVRPLFPGSEDHDEVTFRYGCAIPQPRRYTTRDCFHVLRTWPASKLWRRIALAVLSFTAWAALVTAAWHVRKPACMLGLVPHSLLGSALGLLLVYRTNTANDRFWEGRKMWERIVNSSRDLVSLMSAHSGHVGFERLSRTGRLLSAFAVCISEYVVGPGSKKHALPRWRLLGDEEDFVASSTNPPCRIAQLLLRETTQIPDSKDGLFTNRERSQLNGMIAELHHAVAQGERLVQTPIPQSYVRHTSRFLTLWLATLPFGLCHLVGWWTPAVVCAIAWALIGINDLGLGIEHPFDGPQSLRMQVMCNTVHAAVTDTMHAVTAGRFAGLKRAFLERDLQGPSASANTKPCLVAEESLHDHRRNGARRDASSQHFLELGQHSADPFLMQEMRGTDRLLGRTALHHAVYAGDERMVWRLISSGASVNATDNWDGSTPLDVARARNHTNLAQALVQAGGVSNVFEDAPHGGTYSAGGGLRWSWAPAAVAA